MILINTDIDWPATRENLEIINLPVWARKKGFSPCTVRLIVNELYPHKGMRYIQVLQGLRQDGFLVERDVA
jgi:hypothetical protein